MENITICLEVMKGARDIYMLQHETLYQRRSVVGGGERDLDWTGPRDEEAMRETGSTLPFRQSASLVHLMPTDRSSDISQHEPDHKGGIRVYHVHLQLKGVNILCQG